MRIIKEGKLPQEKEFEAKCHYCKTVFAFTKRDGEVSKHNNRIILVCPFCYTPISIRL